MRLVFGAGKLDSEVDDVEGLFQSYHADDGLRYLDYEPVAGPDVLVPDDLAITILINSRANATAFKSVQDHAHEIDLNELPTTPLEATSSEERDLVAKLIAAAVAAWPSFAASVATKVLHKKTRVDHDPGQRGGIRCLDELGLAREEGEAGQHPLVFLIRETLEWIFTDLVRQENTGSGPHLRGMNREGPGSRSSST